MCRSAHPRTLWWLDRITQRLGARRAAPWRVALSAKPQVARTSYLLWSGGIVPFALKNHTLAWILVVVSLLAVSLLSAVGAFNSKPTTFIAAASGDTYLSSYAPSASHGTAPVLWASHDRYENETLLAFDISGKLRPGDLVVQARIRLTISDVAATRFPISLTTGRTLTNWQENTTTFNTAPLLAFDTSTSTALGTTQSVSRGDAVWIDVTRQLHRWHSYGGPSNFGTVLMMGSGSGDAALGFASRENTQLNQPVLEVTFQPGPRNIYSYTLGLPTAGVAATRPD